MILADFHIPRSLRPAVAQVARVLCPADPIEQPGMLEHVVDYLELQLRALPAGFRAGVVAGIAALEAGAALRPRSLGRRFSQLAPDQAQAWFASWWHSPIGLCRTLVKALKSLVALAFYDSQPMRDRLSYHPDAWISKVASQRLLTWGLEIERHERELTAREPLLHPGRLVRKVHPA